YGDNVRRLAMQLSRRDVLRISPPTPAMSAPMATRLADLARDHPEWRLWLALLSVAQGTFGDPLWVRAVPDGPATVEPEPLPAPLLEGGGVLVDSGGSGRFARPPF